MKKLILASQSEGRKMLLEKTGVAFTVEPSNYEEDMTLDLPPHELAQELSRGKARDVASRNKDSIVIAADTFVVQDEKVLGKPKDKEEAAQMLQSLSGRSHQHITAYTVIDADTKKEITKSEETTVYFKKLTAAEIEQYIATGEPLAGRAGAYAIQDKAAIFIKKIEGEATSVVGLPMCSLNSTLQEFGVTLLG